MEDEEERFWSKRQRRVWVIFFAVVALVFGITWWDVSLTWVMAWGALLGSAFQAVRQWRSRKHKSLAWREGWYWSAGLLALAGVLFFYATFSRSCEEIAINRVLEDGYSLKSESGLDYYSIEVRECRSARVG